MERVQGYHSSVAATIANGAAESSIINFRGYAGGLFQIPASFTGASVSFVVSATETGTYTALHDATNTVVSQTVTSSKSYPLPASLFGAGFFKFVSASNETGAKTITVSLKY